MSTLPALPMQTGGHHSLEKGSAFLPETLVNLIRWTITDTDIFSNTGLGQPTSGNLRLVDNPGYHRSTANGLLPVTYEP
jgi:hypothetical protein